MTPVEVTTHITAAPEEVFRYLTDPARYVQWMGAEAKLEPQPGGVYRVQMPPGSTRVTVSLKDENGGTRLTLQHDDLPTPELREGHRIAWNVYLGRLAIRAAGGDPGPDPHA